MTYIIIIFTAIISIISFNNSEYFSRLLLNPYQFYHRKEYYRIISHGFIHADWLHLIVNMFVLYYFGNFVEYYFDSLAEEGFMQYPKLWFTLFYVGGIIVSSLTTIFKHKDNAMYNCVGASGAVSAMLFCAIFFAPFEKITLYFAIKMPGIVFGVLYLIYSQYMSRRNAGNINHDAHFTGAVFGFLFPLIIDYHTIYIFINEITKKINF